MVARPKQTATGASPQRALVPVTSAPSSTSAAPQTATGGAGASRPQQIVVTRDKEVIYHEISDDKLDAISQYKVGQFSGALWTLAGTALGSMAPALFAIWHLFNGRNIDKLDAFTLVIFLCSTAGAIAFGVVERVNNIRSKDDAERIRKRPRHSR